MNPVTWTKQSLAHSLSTRVDQGKFGPALTEYIMSADITDEMVEAWQEFYDANMSNPLVIENEYIRVYQSIAAGF